MRRLGTGIGWRPEIADAVERLPGIDWVEVVAENVCPGHLPESLLRLRERGVTVIPHGVSLGLGGAERPDEGRLTALAERVEALGAPLVTEHIAFVRAGGALTASPPLEAGHLLPVPRTRDALEVLCENVRIAQDALPVPLALENIAALFSWPGEELTEGEFLSELVERTGVRLLIDVANLHTNHVNRGEDPAQALAALPLEAIAYVHVAGGFERDGVWHDSHAHPVPPPVLALLTDLATRISPPGVLLERDENFPERAELQRELTSIREALTEARTRASRGTAGGGAGAGGTLVAAGSAGAGGTAAAAGGTRAGAGGTLVAAVGAGATATCAGAGAGSAAAADGAGAGVGRPVAATGSAEAGGAATANGAGAGGTVVAVGSAGAGGTATADGARAGAGSAATADGAGAGVGRRPLAAAVGAEAGGTATANGAGAGGIAVAAGSAGAGGTATAGGARAGAGSAAAAVGDGGRRTGTGVGVGGGGVAVLARPLDGGRSRETARERLAVAEAAVLSALVAGTPVPEGFDRVRMGVQARALAAKRADVVAKVAPELPVILGAGYRPAFLEYARKRPMTGGYRRDALEFAGHVLSAGLPEAAGTRRDLREWWLDRAGPAPRSRKPAARVARAARRVLLRRG